MSRSTLAQYDQVEECLQFCDNKEELIACCEAHGYQENGHCYRIRRFKQAKCQRKYKS